MQLLNLKRRVALILSLSCALLCLYVISHGSSADALETKSKFELSPGPNMTRKKSDSCTNRCHVNYMAYENKFEVTQRAGVFRHKTHSFE